MNNKLIKFFVVMVMLAVMGCNSNSDKLSTDLVNNPKSAEGRTSNKIANIEFEKLEHDFGTVISGEVVLYKFKFKNSGNADLLIAEVSSTCGCTVAEYPKKPIKPGETKFIEVTFDSHNRGGFQNKTVTLLTNSENSKTYLKIKAKVIRP
ncbi:MAG: DUF1573 domain-containing protein [Bacteroidota bacterium]|nr:DUF1573 domain-containing protein [Bacteroidota bacterium]